MLNSELSVVALPEGMGTDDDDSLASGESYGMTWLASEDGAETVGSIGDLGRRRTLWSDDQSKGRGGFSSGTTNGVGWSEVAPVLDNFEAKVECWERAVGLASLLARTDGILLAPDRIPS